MRQLNLLDKAFLLKKTALFGSLDLDLLLTIADKMEPMHLKQGEKIIHIGHTAVRMFFIVEGKIAIQNKTQILAELGPGEFFGDEGMFNEMPRAYEAISSHHSMLLILSRSHLLGIIDECPSVAVALLEAYSVQIDFRKRSYSRNS